MRGAYLLGDHGRDLVLWCVAKVQRLGLFGF